MALRLAPAVLIVVAFVVVSAQVIQLELNTELPVFTTHPNYLSFTIDEYYFTPSVWPVLNSTILQSQYALNLVSHLTPAFVRFGGTDADQIFYTMPSSEDSSVSSYSTYNFSSQQWDAVNQFVQTTGLDLVLDVNVLPRLPDGSWDPSNFIDLLEYTIDKGYNVYAYELGNEPDVFPSTYNITITPQQLAEDYMVLSQVLQSHGVTSGINGPAIAYQSQFLAQFASAFVDLENPVRDVTWHHYYGDGPDFNVADFYSVTTLDSLIPILSQMQQASMPLTSTGSALWIGETSSTYGGGTPGASTSYVAGFLWLDKLGLAALFGNSVLCRQDFYGGNYGLYAPPAPYPDYWASVIFKQLIGTRVLGVTNSTHLGRTTRVYAFCHRNISGAVTVLALNINSASTSFVFQSSFPMYPRLEYHLQAPDGDLSSANVQLNGVTLETSESGALPPFTPIEVNSNTPMSLNATSFGFFVFPEAQVASCL